MHILAKVTVAVCLLEFVQSQVLPLAPNYGGRNDCPEYSSCMRKRMEVQNKCNQCIQKDYNTGSIVWDSNTPNCTATQATYARTDLEKFLRCEDIYQQKMKQYQTRSCEIGNQVMTCLGQRARDCQQNGRGYPMPLTNNAAGRKKRSPREKRQVTNGFISPPMSQVYTSACSYATSKLISTGCEALRCLSPQEECYSKTRSLSEQLNKEREIDYTEYERCIRLFDPTYGTVTQSFVG